MRAIRKHDSRRKPLAHRFLCVAMSVVLALGMTPGLALAAEGGGDGTPAGVDLVAGSAQLGGTNEPAGSTRNGNEPEGDEHDYAGTKFTWTDETVKVEYTCYVTSPKDQDATAALYWISYVGDDSSRYAEPVTLEYGELDVEIPSSIDGYSITELGSTDYGTYDYLMYDLEVGSITVPATVNKVNRINPDYYLREIIFDPACQVTEIPDNFIAKYYLETDASLERVVLPDSVERIGAHAFRRNVNLASVNMPANLKTIGDYAFASTSLNAINLPEGLETIGEGSFCSDPAASEVTATSLDIPDSVKSIGDYAFANAGGQGWDKKTGVYGVDDSLGTQPSSLTSITLGSGLAHIGAYAFANSQITNLVLPSSLEEIGNGAFDSSSQLQTVIWDDLDAAKLTSIGSNAFDYSPQLRSFEMPVSVTEIGDYAFSGCEALRDISLPPGLVSLGEYAFINCSSLETVSIPGTLEDFGKGAFERCTALDDLTLSEGLETIGRFAFVECSSLKKVTIPRSVRLIDQHAFGDWSVKYGGNYIDSLKGAGIEELNILGGSVPLSIGAAAFAGCVSLNGKTITLPKRVSKLGGGSFVFIQDATFVIENPNIEVYDSKADSSVDILDAVHYYLSALTSELTLPISQRDFALIYSDDPVEEEEEDGSIYYIVNAPDPWASDDYFDVQKFLPKPNGSVVRYPNTLTRETSPTFWGYLLINEYDENNYDNSIRPTFEAVEMPADEEETYDPVVEVAGAGRLEVTTKGSTGITANICVFDADGNLAASAQALNRYALITGLEPGAYTVVAFSKNGYFSTVGSLDGFAALGIDASQYVRASAMIVAGEDTQLELTVPKMTATSTNLVQSSSVAISKQQTYKDQEFFATVNFRMESGKTASALKVKLPEGLVLTSVSSAKKNYGTSGYDAATRTLTVALDSADAQTGRIYVGLKAAETGRHVVSASVVSDGTTVPVGDAATTVRALSLDLPTEPVQGKAFTATVHAAPNTEVTLQVADMTETVTTNKAGNAQTSFDLSDVETTLSYTIVVASVDDDGTTISETGMVEFEATQTSIATLEDFTFIHAGKQYYIVRAGHTQPPSKYYTYIANGKETNKYWTFTATYESAMPLKVGGAASQVIQTAYCTVRVQMLDGSSRFVKLPIISSVEQDDGTYLNTFAGTLYLEQAGDHVFPTSLVPCAFDVALHTAFDSDEVERTQADIDAMRMMNFEPLPHWKAVRLPDRADEIFGDEAEEDATGQAVLPWESDEDYSWVFFYQAYWEEVLESYEDAVDKGWISQEEFEQVQTAVDQGENLVGKAGEALDFVTGAEKPMAECDDFSDWFINTYDLEDGLPFDSDQLANDGWDVTPDGNAGSANAGGTAGGTPTDGIMGTNYTEPSNVATKTTYGNDGSVQSVQYRDSNGNGATIPVGKALANFDVKMTDGGSDWGDITNDVLQAGLIDYNTTKAAVLAADYEIYKNLPDGSAAKRAFDKYCASRFLQHGEKPIKGASWLLTFRNRAKQSKELANHYENAAEARGNVENLEIRLNYLRMHNLVGTPCWKALVNERDWAIIAADGLTTHRDWSEYDIIRGVTFDVLGLVGDKAGPVGSAAVYAGDKITGKAVSYNMDSNKRVLDPALKKLNEAHLKRLEDCGEDKPGDAPNVVPPILDPSGIVYEAFPANLLAGVTATVFAVEEGVVADEPWVAGDYDQENPQVTGSEGFFGWDVPQGAWQVKFAKDGYESVSTDPLQVPPPQVGLEVGMIATAAPEVESATADARTLEVAFNQYMDAGDDTLADAVVKVNGAAVAASDLSWKDVVDATTGQFSKVLVVPVPAGTKAGDTLSVSVSGVKNYAGKVLASTYAANVSVAPRPARLDFNFEDTISLQVGTSRPTSVRVYDADGSLMEGVRLTASLDNGMFASVDDADAVTDEEGVAKLQLEALMPGMSELTVQVEGTALSGTINLLTTAEANKAARPTIRFVDRETGETVKTIGEGAPNENTVYINRPTDMYVESATEGATIYYTLDGSCPCQNTAGRAANANGTSFTLDGVTTADFIFAANKDGMDYSERLKVNIRLGQDPAEVQDISGASVAVGAQTYTGSALKPAPKVVVGGKTLVAGTDYTVAYKNNVNVGTATVTITAKSAGYSGSKSVGFKISPASIAAATVTANPTSYTWTGSALKPAVTVKVGTRTLVAGTDYTVAYSANTAVGTAKVTVTGKGNYTGTATKNFTIAKVPISKVAVSGVANKTYTGAAQAQGLKATYAGKTLKAGTDYDLAYYNASKKAIAAGSVKAAGTYYVAIKGKGNYTGTSALKAFKVAPRAVTAAAVSGVANKTYTGKAVAQAPKLVYNKMTLKVGTDYTLAYYNSAKKAIAASAVKAAGTYYVAAKGKGNYTGTTALRAFKVMAPSVTYRNNVQSIGWQSWRKDGAEAGTHGRSLRLEALQVKLASKPVSGTVQYRAHVQSVGWQPWVSEGQTAGIANGGKRMEAVQIRLTGEMAKKYDVYYRLHVQTFGWLGWAKNGAQAGSAGYSKRVEAMQVKIVPKGAAAPGKTTDCFRQK